MNPKEPFIRWYPEEIKARNGCVMTTRYIAETHYDALAAELARCRSANVYDGAAHKRVAELEAEVEALKHDLEKSMANHVADINGFESEREVSK